MPNNLTGELRSLQCNRYKCQSIPRIYIYGFLLVAYNNHISRIQHPFGYITFVYKLNLVHSVACFSDM